MVQIDEIAVVNGWSLLVSIVSSLHQVLDKLIVSLNTCIGEVALSLGLLDRPGSSLETLKERVKVCWCNEVDESMTAMSSELDWHVEEIVTQVEFIIDDGHHILKSVRKRNVLDHDRTTSVKDDEIRRNLEKGM